MKKIASMHMQLPSEPKYIKKSCRVPKGDGEAAVVDCYGTLLPSEAICSL